MRNILLIARREYMEQIRGRAFKISTVALPLLIAALLSFSHYMARKANTGKHIAIVADDAVLANEVRLQMLDDKDAQYTVDVTAPATAEERATWQEKVRAKAIDGVLAIDSSSPEKVSATYTSLSVADVSENGGLQSALNRAVINERMIGKGITPAEADAMLAKVSIDALQLDKDGKIGKSNGGATVIKATLMLAVAKPGDLLAGKLLGVGGVGLTQIAVWTIGATVFMGSALATSLLTGDIAIHFSWMEGIFFPIYFVLGFALFSSIFSGLAATCGWRSFRFTPRWAFFR